MVIIDFEKYVPNSVYVKYYFNFIVTIQRIIKNRVYKYQLPRALARGVGRITGLALAEKDNKSIFDVMILYTLWF